MKLKQLFSIRSGQQRLSSIGLGLIILLPFDAPAARAAVSETHSPNSVLVGGRLTFTFTLSNLGTTPGIFTNSLPPNTVFVSANVTNGTYAVSNNVFCYTPSTASAVPEIAFDLVLTPVTAQIITNMAYWVPATGDPVACFSLVPVTAVQAGPKMVVGRVDHQSILLRDGRVLVTGGLAVNGSYLTTTASAEVYTPKDDQFTSVGNMGTPRAFHTATLLTNGMILVAGGQRAYGVTNASLEVFDPANNVFLPAATLAVPRAMHSATRLPNGDVIIAGGAGSNTQVERVSLRNGQWTAAPAGNLAAPRSGHLALLLPSGEILLAGGTDNSHPFAEKFNPATGLSVPVAPAGHGMPAVAGTPEKVLLHGWSIQPEFGAELYDIESNRFEPLAAPPQPASGEHYLTLSTGEVLITAGYMSYAVTLFNPRTGTFRSSYPLSITRSDHKAVELADGRVLLTGGYDIIDTMNSDMRSTEFYALRLDQDQDGMDDAWELANGLDPARRADAIEDADGDGHTNLQEYLAGTDPHNPTSSLRFESVQRDASNLHISFSSVLGKFYRVQQTTDLLNGNWVDVTGILAGTGRPIEVTAPIVAGAAPQSYRVLLLP